MFRRRRLIGACVLGSALLLGALPTTSDQLHSQAVGPSAAARVVVAEDKTVDAQCRTWDDLSTYARPCAPGSVILTREMTYAEAKRTGVQHYVVLTQDVPHDRERIAQLAASVHAAYQGPEAIRPSACTLRYGRFKGGSYLSDPNNANSARISYEVTYDVFETCEIRNMRNRAKSSTASGIRWERIDIVVNNRIVQSRGYNIPLTDNYSAWYQGLTAFEGNTYSHVSYLAWNLARPFGYLVL